VAALLLYARLDMLIPVVAEAIGGLGSWPRVGLLIFLEVLSVLLVTTLLFRAAFPLGVRAPVGSLAPVGRRVGDLYTANTVGSIIGALAVGFGLIPLLGVRGSFLALALTNVVLGTVLVAGASRRGRVPWAVVGVVLAVLAVFLVPPDLF